jgi:hypothetical protein
MPHSAQEKNAGPDSVYVDDNRAPLTGATQIELEGRYAEILWFETQLSRPLRPHRESYLSNALTKIEAVYEAQWMELEMAVGVREAFRIRRRVEAGSERPARRGLPATVNGDEIGKATTSPERLSQRFALKTKSESQHKSHCGRSTCFTIIQRSSNKSRKLLSPVEPMVPTERGGSNTPTKISPL